MAQDKKLVEAITSMEEDFAQWYTDVVRKAELIDYTSVKGCMVIKPAGYAIWENIRNELDRRFKEAGVENVYLPMFIPESLLQKEKDHVEGFAPEVAWVTKGGLEDLQERLCVRPTSETLFCDFYKNDIHSYRDLPKVYNQWCSVVRWEKTTRPFLRTAEFLWQEGHTVHATAEEAQEETMQMLGVYRDFCEKNLAIPVYCGQKSEKEKFAGARATYSIEAMMQDGKALQSGTSHNFGTNFSEPFEIKYLDKDGTQKYAHETSWGTSTRLIGAIIMTHGDERGLKLPPMIAPYQVVVVPVAAHKEGVLEGAKAVADKLTAAGLRVKFDDRDNVTPGWKFNEWELKGVPVRVEIGPRDLAEGKVMSVRRDTFEKAPLDIEGLEDEIKAMLDAIQTNMFEIARAFRDAHTADVHNMEELGRQVDGGYAKAMWCGDQACEDEIKDRFSASSRCMPFDQTPIGETCVCCGKPAKKVIYFAKAY